MKLSFNDAQIVLEPYNTNFVDCWMNWVFGRSGTLLLNFDEHAIQLQYTQWLENVDNLNRILDSVNDLAVTKDLPEKWHYSYSNVYDSNYLQKIHEQWAEITKQSWEQHLPIFDPDTKNIYDSVNSKLRDMGMDYNNINNSVHSLENTYKYFSMYGVRFNLSNDNNMLYNITAKDTSFVKDSISVPYRDIGRPQYEKYCLSGLVDHPEISNYQNIISAIEIQSSPMQQPCVPSFIAECEQENTDAFGPYVSIANISGPDTQQLGHMIISNLSNDTSNTLRLIRD